MQVVKKAVADKILVNSLFTPVNGKTLNRGRFDMGKYDPAKSFIGRDVPDLPGVHAVYQEKRKDSHGPYIALCCIHE